MLRLRHSKALNSKNSEEQDEYDYIKEINKELGIESREEYASDKIRNKHSMYIEKAEEYFRNKGVWKNWNDYLGIKTENFIQDKDKWIKFCKEKNILSSEDYKEKCKIYKELPANPEEYYKDFKSIIIELELNKNRRKRK